MTRFLCLFRIVARDHATNLLFVLPLLASLMLSGCCPQAEPARSRSASGSHQTTPKHAALNATVAVESVDSKPREVVSELLTLLNRRIALMPDVARYKYLNRLPVKVPEREAALLFELGKAAEEKRVDRQFAESVFRAQFASSRALQAGLIAKWSASGQPEFGHVPDLASEIRPQITALSEAILDKLSALQHFEPTELARLYAELAPELLTADEVTSSIRNRMLKPLLTREPRSGANRP